MGSGGDDENGEELWSWLRMMGMAVNERGDDSDGLREKRHRMCGQFIYKFKFSRTSGI